MDVGWADVNNIVIVDPDHTEAGLKTFERLFKEHKIGPGKLVYTFDPSSVDGVQKPADLAYMFQYERFANVLHANHFFRNGDDLVAYFDQNELTNNEKEWNKTVYLIEGGSDVQQDARTVLHAKRAFEITSTDTHEINFEDNPTKETAALLKCLEDHRDKKVDDVDENIVIRLIDPAKTGWVITDSNSFSLPDPVLSEIDDTADPPHSEEQLQKQPQMELQKQVVVVKQSPQLQTYQDDSESEVKADTESEPEVRKLEPVQPSPQIDPDAEIVDEEPSSAIVADEPSPDIESETKSDSKQQLQMQPPSPTNAQHQAKVDLLNRGVKKQSTTQLLTHQDEKSQNYIIDVADADVETDITDTAVAPNPMLKYGIIIFIILAVLLVCINFFVPKPKDLVETMTDAAASFTEPEVPEELPEADNSVLILTLSIVGGGLLGVAALIGGCYWAFVSGRLERYLPTLSEKARLAKEFFAKRKRDSDSGGAAAW
eukprot:45361_1